MKAFLTLAALLVLQPLAPLQAAVQAPPLTAAKDAVKPGLKLTLGAGGKTDVRVARLIALAVPPGAAVSPFLPAGAFTARWEGAIVSSLRGEYTFAAEIRGALKVSINGQQILEGAGDATAQVVNKTLQLNKGSNAIVAEFASDGKEPAHLLFTWNSKEFPSEPVPPMVFVHQSADDPLREASRIREGRQLFAQFRCTACHGDPQVLPPRGEGLPELAQDAPILAELGAKFKEPWLAQWIGDPHSIRPHSLMPQVFPKTADGQIDQRARDLAAYFIAQGQRDDTTPAEENAPLGGALFANFGCISCHTPPDFQGEDEYDRVPLSHVKAKWQPAALRGYLKDPAQHYPWTRMPNFRLTDEEAERLTSYLISGEQRDFPTGPAGDPAKGAQILVSANCLNCHAGMPPTTQPTLAATVEAGWEKGCLAAEAADRKTAPDFHFSAEQRDALRAFAAAGFESLKHDVPVEFAERQLTNLRCTACHPRDSQLSVWTQVENDAGALTAAFPHEDGQPMGGTHAPLLTWVGEKLHTAWAEPFIVGESMPKPRPWMIARMPGFGAPAKGIAAGLSLQHGFLPDPVEKAAAAPELVRIGEQLVGENGGFNCTTCHGVGDRAATAVFEAPGINLAFSHERLRKFYYDRWVLNPLRIDPETKMPMFADDRGHTALTDLLKGEAPAQFDAIWKYLGTVGKPTRSE